MSLTRYKAKCSTGNLPRRWKRANSLVQLAGKKLKGQWTLVRLRRSHQKDDNAWLLIKTNEDARTLSARADDTSALSGRSMETDFLALRLDQKTEQVVRAGVAG